MDNVYSLHRGTQPLLLSLPHVGTVIPDDQKARYVERALAAEDTDWHLERLYGFARELGASVLVPRYSRYLVDLNRPPENAPMYPGANNTELCPTRFFTGEPLYRDARAPDDAEIARRVDRYWRPYHDALRDELMRIRGTHGHVVLFDGHSIRSELPWLFEGRLPDLNLGTAEGRSCAGELRAQLCGVLAAQSRWTHVTDGRFKGGYITRQYGRPAEQVHAVQLEMCWSCYMAEAAPWGWDAAQAAQVQPVLRELLGVARDWRP
jgi:N-formylglutamate deformylase